MTHPKKGPEPHPERIESPPAEDDKTRPLRTMESVDPDGPTVEMATRPDLASTEIRIDAEDEEDAEYEVSSGENLLAEVSLDRMGEDDEPDDDEESEEEEGDD